MKLATKKNRVMDTHRIQFKGGQTIINFNIDMLWTTNLSNNPL